MNILLCSVHFRPSVGGIETMSALLADGLCAAGHDVTVVTQTPGTERDVRGERLRVLRAPAAHELMRAVRRADVVLHNQISLRLAWPLLLLRRPWVVVHHTWLPEEGPSAAAGRIKRLALRFACNVAVSRALADALPVPCRVVPNCYDAALFRIVDGIPREREFVFVGRLVSDKGCALLVHAMALLRARRRYPRLTIIGDGPEEPALRDRVLRWGLTPQVDFAGRLSGEPLVRALNAHRFVVVPSVWEEPFGLVALEAQACGCRPLVADSGALPEAAGPDALVFPKRDAAALATTMAQALLGGPADDLPSAARARHLRAHDPSRTISDYLEVLADALDRHRPVARAA